MIRAHGERGRVAPWILVAGAAAIALAVGGGVGALALSGSDSSTTSTTVTSSTTVAAGGGTSGGASTSAGGTEKSTPTTNKSTATTRTKPAATATSPPKPTFDFVSVTPSIGALGTCHNGAYYVEVEWHTSDATDVTVNGKGYPDSAGRGSASFPCTRGVARSDPVNMKAYGPGGETSLTVDAQYDGQEPP